MKHMYFRRSFLRRALFFAVVFGIFLGTGSSAKAGYIIGFSPDSPMAANDMMIPLFPEAGIYMTDFAEASQAEEMDGVEFVLENLTFALTDDEIFDCEKTVYNDTLYQDGDLWNLDMVQAPGILNRNLRGQNVRIGILDSGINLEHEDMQKVFIGGKYNTTNPEVTDNDEVTDTEGHGTFVSGIIAADVNNYLGVAGIADQASIIPIKCFDGRLTSVAAIIAGLKRAYDADCQVVNMSLGISESILSEQDVPVLKKMLKQALEPMIKKKVILVCAAGNDKTTLPDTAEQEGFVGTDALSYPTAMDQVIGVGSVKQTGRISLTSQKNRTVDVTAPGDGVVGISGSNNSGYLLGNGTSYATPHVSAAAAVLKGLYPELDHDLFMELIKKTALDKGIKGRDDAYGWGILQIDDMVKLLLEEYVEDPVYFAPAVRENGLIKTYFHAKPFAEARSIYFASYDNGGMNGLMQFQIPKNQAVEGNVAFAEQNEVKRFYWQGLMPVGSATSLGGY